MSNHKRNVLLLCCALIGATPGFAQKLQKNYFEWYKSDGSFANHVIEWEKGNTSPDDNFFISRVKPRYRFRNANTQVRSNLNETNDKKLVAWLPMGNEDFKSMQNGVFDSEVFSMWSYVTHWGDWNAPFGRVPAPLMDVAHKNGVAVTSELGIPWGALTNDARTVLQEISAIGGERMAKYLRYVGQNGLSYNSEFNDTQEEVVPLLHVFHESLVRSLSVHDPLVENIWYDGTNDVGYINFDQGLGEHNKLNFGDGDHKRTSLFFNYNWWLDNAADLRNSLNYIKSMNRSSLDLYAGFNMQGGDPNKWSLLAPYNISIGLWGAHSANMFWESRGEKGGSPEKKQMTYLTRIERWFTGGTRNPANTPAIVNKMNYNADNFDFHGMSTFMSARSALNWDLSEQPFITFFNLGNGKFFNWKGSRANNGEWYNLGVQDYLPTWRWWFSTSLLGHDVPTSGLDATFTWDEAYVGGSCMRVFGSTDGEYLHLFKTKYALQAGDVITVRYKLLNGSGKVNLVLTAEGNEHEVVGENDLNVMSTSQLPDQEWKVATFQVPSGLTGKTLALAALHFEQTSNLDLYLGEFSIVRSGLSTAPTTPEIVSSTVFSYNNQGVDGKVVFNMANDKPAGEPCYNVDVKTSLFKVYAQQEGEEPTLMGIVNSWASMVFRAPVNTAGTKKMRFGVAAVSLDMTTDSPIGWGEYHNLPTYVGSDDVQLSQTVINPNEPFNISYVDANHTASKFDLIKDGTVVASQTGNSVDFTLAEAGVYDLKVTGSFNKFDTDGNVIGTEQKEVTYPGYVNITGVEFGSTPKILSLTANDKTDGATVEMNEQVRMNYTARPADARLSRGIDLKEQGAVFDAGGIKANPRRPWTLAFWVKFKSMVDGTIQIIDDRDQGAAWPWNHWGQFWGTYNSRNQEFQFVIRSRYSHGAPAHETTWRVPFYIGKWTHFAVVMESTPQGIREVVYVDGKRAEALRWKYNGEGTGMNPQYVYTTAVQNNLKYAIGVGRGGNDPTATMDAIIDDVRYYDKSLSDDEILKIKNNEAVAGQAAYWSFEKEPEADNWFTNESTEKGGTVMENARFAFAKFVSGASEGAGSYEAVVPTYSAGTTTVSGDAYVIETKPTWSAFKGLITPVSGNDREGSATVTYPNAGEYEVTLKLTNDYGSDTKTYSVIKVNVSAGVASVDASQMKSYTVGKELFVEFATSGQYTVEVCNAAGSRIASKSVTASDGSHIQVSLGQPGVYILRVAQGGRTVHTSKLLCK